MVSATTDVSKAAATLIGGDVIAYPTEGVWGLGCDPDNEAALRQVLSLKQRDPAKGLILIAASIEQLAPWLTDVSADERKQLQSAWPGPHTWLVPDNGRSHPLVRGNHQQVALRVTDHPLSAALCTAFGGPIVSTSANRANEPSALTAQQVEQIFGDELPLILDGATGGRREPSTIRNLADGRWLRGGPQQ
ncbi:Threonylcarbamoyl-AMP synthase [Carnimonas sp. R-84981]|uniref:L-threonylcarbamoyladenylate synthase n=1 Tax=Carnimonas bestiolae TaxID=3402172 RepID=UPI003EDBA054